MSRGIILLSGGLDSLVSLGLGEYNIELALTFNYGQKAFADELIAAKNICKHYNIRLEVIELPWLQKITRTSLVSDKEVPQNPQDYEQSMKNVWVPNRNGLFLNIAAAYADGEDYDYILIGANKEEAQTFSDNTQEFIDRVNLEFEYSTIKRPKVIAPLINFNKNDIVRIALEKGIPLQFVKSCYVGGAKHCGKCESCIRLKKALLNNNDKIYIKELF